MSRLRRNAVRYALVGVLNSAIGFLVVAAVLYVAPRQAVLANATGFGVGFLISFALNRTWTFSDPRPLRLSLAAYVALLAVSYAVNLVVVLVAGRWAALGLYLPQLMGMCAYTALAFCGSHFIVFRSASFEGPG